MRYIVALAATLLWAVQPAAAQGHFDLVKQAVTAAGGEQALRALKVLVIKGDARHWEPDQSLVAGGSSRILGESKFTLTLDLAYGMSRTDWDRAMVYPAVQTMKYSEVLTPTFGFVSDAKGSRAMSGFRVATQLRELQRMSPTFLLKLLDRPGSVVPEGGIKVGSTLMPAVTFKDGATSFVVLFDKKTHLPSMIRTRDDDPTRGDSNFDLKLEDWKPVDGAMVAHGLTYFINDSAVGRLNYTEVKAEPQVDAALFTPTDQVKASANAPATGTVPYQWFIRRNFMGLLVDSDLVFVPTGGSLKLVELAPNVQHVVGGSHNNLIVAMSDGLVIFDAPISQGQARWVIDAAKAKYGKPVKYLVLTHHHVDHAAGVRAYMAEGAKIVVPTPDKKYFQKIALFPHALVPDALEKARISPDIIEVKDELTLKDSAAEIHIHRIPNPHVDGMLIAQILPANVVCVTDLWSPGRDTEKNANTLSLSDALKRLGISGATIAGGHGATAKQSDLDTIVAADKK